MGVGPMMARWLVAVPLAVLGFFLGAQLALAWCQRPADGWYEGEAARQLAAARSVERWVDGNTTSASFTTGSDTFDGEWLFGTMMMAGAGLAQVSQQQPDQAANLRPALDRAIDAMLSPRARAFDQGKWGGEDPLTSLEGEHAHVAYLGYSAFVLGLARRLYPDHPRAPLHDRIVAALDRRFAHEPTLLLETYPGERYVVDNASAIAALALHEATTGERHPMVQRWAQRCRERFRHPPSGLLYQSWTTHDDTPLDAPRASGTALAAYFLGHGVPDLAAELSAALTRTAERPVFGFGLLQEYAPGFRGSGDIDSGPIIAGYSISATGFALSSCRLQGDRACFQRRYATFHLFGAPLWTEGRHTFVSGGPLADAIMLAMLTAPRPDDAGGPAAASGERR